MLRCTLALQKCGEAYSVHGFWFEDNRSKRCPFKSDTLPEALVHRLERAWFSCTGSDEAFWKHEYCKHGRGYFETAEAYFEATLKAYEFVQNSVFLFTGKEVRIPLSYNKEHMIFEYRFF